MTVIEKGFTWKSFNNKKEAFAYANKAMQKDATYVEIMRNSPRDKEMDNRYIVQHNAKEWIR